MNGVMFKKIIITSALLMLPLSAKRPPKPPKEPLTAEQKQAIIVGAVQIMGSVCEIIKDPRNPQAVGNSIGQVIQAIINIILERFAHKSGDTQNDLELENLINELTQEMQQQLTNALAIQKL